MGANGYGAETPNMDILAAAGMRMTDMHAMSVCTPSRAALLTGRLGLRTGVVVNFQTDAMYGLNRSELTLAELLKPAGYDTKVIGKWHLGTAAGFHPTYRGFDEYLGIPYSVDMGCVNCENANIPADAPCPYDPQGLQQYVDVMTDGDAAQLKVPALPLYNTTGQNCGAPAAPNCSATIIEQPVVLEAVTPRYAAAAVEWIQRHGPGGSRNGVPFFLYVPFSHIHVPLAHDPKWTNKSKANTIFADTLLELDDAIGQIWSTLQSTGLDKDTLVMLTGDNGPWNVKCDLAGSQGPWLGSYQAQLGGGGTGKMSTWEAGHREPGVFVWPGRIPAGTVNAATISTLDIVPTVASLAGVQLPSDRVYDGYDLSPVLFEGATSVRSFLAHPDTQTGNLTAIRYNQFKAYLATYGAPACNIPASKTLYHMPPLVFDLSVDPAESNPVRNAAVEQAVVDYYNSLILNISSTYHSRADYAEGGNASWPCCNPNHVLCRCTQ